MASDAPDILQSILAGMGAPEEEGTPKRYKIIDDVPALAEKAAPNSPKERSQFSLMAKHSLDTFHASEENREIVNEVSFANEFANREFEGSRGVEADQRLESYERHDPEAQEIVPDNTARNPEDDSFSPGTALRKTAAFLFSDEIAMLGFKWDGEEYNWRADTIKEQFVEHPYSSALTIASYVVPIGFAAKAGQRAAKRGKELAELAASRGVDVGESVGKGVGIFGARGEKAINAIDAAATTSKGTRLLPIGGLTKVGFKFDDYAQMVKAMADPKVNLDSLTPTGEKVWGTGMFSPNKAKAIQNAKTAEEIHKLVPQRTLKQRLVQNVHMERSQALRAKMRKDPTSLTKREKIAYGVQKKFQNSYFSSIQDIDKDRISGMHKFFVQEKLGEVLAKIPAKLTPEMNKDIYKYWLESEKRIVPKHTGEVTGANAVDYHDSYAALAAKVGDDAAEWVDDLAKKWTKLFDEQAAEGFIDEETVKMFRGTTAEDVGSGFHLPAVLKGTPGFGDIGGNTKQMVARRQSEIASGAANKGVGDKEISFIFREGKPNVAAGLGGPTTQHRGKFTSRQSVMENIDDLETGVAEMTTGGFIKDKMLLQVHRNFRDAIINNTEHMTTSRANYDLLTSKQKENWIDVKALDDLVPGLSAKISRMVKIKAKNTPGLNPADYDELPMIDKYIAESFFGSEGSARQASGAFQKSWELLTSIHKTSKTVLSPATHAGNLSGNMVFLSMAGMNPFSKVALNDAKHMTDAFIHMSKKMAASAKKVKDGGKGQTLKLEDLMNKEGLVEALGKNRYITDDLGEKIDLAEMFSDPKMIKLTEAQSFDSVEGLSNVKNMLQQIENAETTGWGHDALKTLGNAFAGIAENPGIKPTLDASAAAYLAEDMVPKMMYAMNLARKGYGADAIVLEVGRRLPQYESVGQLAKSARKMVLPWITFPAESARIMKNNMMDRPISTSMWMQGPQIAQAALTNTGVGTPFDQINQAKEMSPSYANKHTTMMLNENDSPEVLSTIGGGFTGGTIGAAMGGARGAAIGGAIGAVGGAIAGSSVDDKLVEYNRAWVGDFLPQYAAFNATNSPEEWSKIDPFSDKEWSGGESVRAAHNMLPVEPFAVFMPVLDVAMGKDSYGQEIETGSATAFAGKMALGMMGHLAPSMMQKWGMKLPGPDGNPIEMAEIFEKNGGQSTLPKAITAGFGGLLLGGLTFMGTKSLNAGKAAGMAGANLAATAGAGTVGALAGSEVNVNRMMHDLGITKDHNKNIAGEWTQDAIGNNLFGVTKSWRSSPESAALQRNLRKRDVTKQKTLINKNFSKAMADGSESRVAAQIGAMYNLMLREYGDAPTATIKHQEWLERQVKSRNRASVFSKMSDEELKRIIDEGAGPRDAAGLEKTRIQRQQHAEQIAEAQMRALNRARNLQVQVEDGMPPKKQR